MDDLDKNILKILLKKQRTMSVKGITEILNEEFHIEVSRPTIARRLQGLKKDYWVIGEYKFNMNKLKKNRID